MEFPVPKQQGLPEEQPSPTDFDLAAADSKFDALDV
jgi:hypothetical protein